MWMRASESPEIFLTKFIAHMPSLVAVFDSAHVGSAPAFFKDLAPIAQENSATQTGAVSLEDKLKPPLNLLTVSQERALHNQNSRTENVAIRSSAYNKPGTFLTKF